MIDDLGNRMKGFYENRTHFSLMRRMYTIIRLDGKAFHTYTKGFDKPFDIGFTDDMNETTRYLLTNIQGAQLAFVQSDEISILLTDFKKLNTEAWFDNNLQKMCSVSASMATAYFNRLRDNRDRNSTKLAFFDSRVFQLPDDTEVENYFIWRQKDAIRNSILSVAQCNFSHKELLNKSCEQLKEKLKSTNNPWENYSPQYKYGRLLTNNEIEIETIRCFPFTENREILSSLIPKKYEEDNEEKKDLL